MAAGLAGESKISFRKDCDPKKLETKRMGSPKKALTMIGTPFTKATLKTALGYLKKAFLGLRIISSPRSHPRHFEARHSK